MFRGGAVISKLAEQTPIYAYIGSFSISTLVMFTESYCCRRVDIFIFGTMACFLFSTICKAYCVVFIFETA